MPPTDPRGLGAAHPSRRPRSHRKKFRDAVAGDVRDYTCNTGSFVRATARCAGFRSDPPSSATRMASRPPGRRAQRHHRAGGGGAGAAAKRGAIPQARGPARRLNATLAQRVEEKTRERDRIWNVSQDLLLVADRNGVWQTVNPAWTRTLGWSEAELLNRTSQWLEHPDDGGITRAQVRETRRAATPPSDSKAASATRTARIAGCPGPACRTGTTSMRSPATSPQRRPRPNG